MALPCQYGIKNNIKLNRREKSHDSRKKDCIQNLDEAKYVINLCNIVSHE